MKRLLVAICLAASSICVHAQTSTTKERDAKLVSHVKQLPVSELDPLLPVLTFEKWLNIEAGADAKFRWGVSDCAEESRTAPEQRDRPLCVEVEAQMKCFESEEFSDGLRAFLEKRRGRVGGE